MAFLVWGRQQNRYHQCGPLSKRASAIQHRPHPSPFSKSATTGMVHAGWCSAPYSTWCLCLPQRIVPNWPYRPWKNYAWAPHSPDLNPLDFWLRGAAKDVVYKEKPATLRELKVIVTNYIRQVTQEVWGKVGNNFSVRLQACQKREGAHIEHINYRKLVDA